MDWKKIRNNYKDFQGTYNVIGSFVLGSGVLSIQKVRDLFSLDIVIDLVLWQILLLLCIGGLIWMGITLILKTRKNKCQFTKGQ